MNRKSITLTLFAALLIAGTINAEQPRSFKRGAGTNNMGYRANYEVLNGRNLPSFVKDYLLKRYAKGEDVDRAELTRFLDTVISL